MWSPRIGFRWDINNDRNYILRGGIGIFTGRLPFVWLSNNFSNTGIQLSTYDTYSTSKLRLILDPNKQTENAKELTASGSQTVNVYDKDFKFTQNLRVNLGFDANIGGIDWTLEGIYSKNLNDIYYSNLAQYLLGLLPNSLHRIFVFQYLLLFFEFHKRLTYLWVCDELFLLL